MTKRKKLKQQKVLTSGKRGGINRPFCIFLLFLLSTVMLHICCAYNCIIKHRNNKKCGPELSIEMADLGTLAHGGGYMITLAIDDISSVAQQIRGIMLEIDPDGVHYAASEPVEIQKFALEVKPDLIWLDIEMPDVNGLNAASEIKTLLPDTNIVFVTGYPEYAIEAFGMHASGYILKPVTQKKLLDEIENLRKPVGSDSKGTELLRVQCFGNFEVFGPNGVVRFRRSLSKEALAYLVDRRGACCTIGEICSVLWEDRTTDKGLKSQCRVIMGSLKKDLESAGAGDVIVKNWNTWGIDASKVSCDYYDFLKGKTGAVNSFRGEYMMQYSWAEMTVGRLFDITEAVAAE